MNDILLVLVVLLVCILNRRIKEMEDKIEVIIFYQKKIKAINEDIKIMSQIKSKNNGGN